MNKISLPEMIFLALIAACIFSGLETRFAQGLGLAALMIFALMRLLWITQGGRNGGKGPRYLPAMILGRKMDAATRAQHERAGAALALPVMIWLVAGLLYSVFPLLGAAFYTHDGLPEVQQFLRDEFMITSSWTAAMFDLATQKTAALWVIGAAAWSAYALGAAHNQSAAFPAALAALFGLCLWQASGLDMGAASLPSLPLTIILFAALGGIPLFRFGRDMLRYPHRAVYAASGIIALGLLLFCFINRADVLPLYMAGWSLAAYLWARTSAPPPKKLRIRQ